MPDNPSPSPQPAETAPGNPSTPVETITALAAEGPAVAAATAPQPAAASPGPPDGPAGPPPQAPPAPQAPSAVAAATPSAAQVLSLAAPSYPVRSRQLGEEGLVLLEVEILPDGLAGQVRVLLAPDYPRLVDAALAAAMQARFSPATRAGLPIRSLIEVPFRFQLQGK